MGRVGGGEATHISAQETLDLAQPGVGVPRRAGVRGWLQLAHQIYRQLPQCGDC